jgi:hypothetical protein
MVLGTDRLPVRTSRPGTAVSPVPPASQPRGLARGQRDRLALMMLASFVSHSAKPSRE